MIQGIIEILLDSSAVTTLVGDNKAGNKPKIFPVVAPQGEMVKYVLLSKVRTFPGNCKDGISDMDQVDFMILHFGTDYIDVDELHEATRTALDGMSSITDAGITFAQIRFVTDKDLFSNEAQKYVRQSDYTCFVKRTTPT